MTTAQKTLLDFLSEEWMKAVEASAEVFLKMVNHEATKKEYDQSVEECDKAFNRWNMALEALR